MTAGPRRRKPRKPEGNQIPTTIPSEQISFDREGFDEMIRSQGVRLVHYRAIPDPTGMLTRGDGHPSGAEHGVVGPGGSDQYLYQEGGILQAFFQSNSTSEPLDVQGVISTSSAYITLPSTYEKTSENSESEPVIVSDQDRFYLKDIEVRVVAKQFVEASVTGVDRLQYPATSVEYLVDSRGVRYCQGEDFILREDGTIYWTGQKQPGQDPGTGRGVVYSVRYRYVPFFIVARIIHEIRVAQVTDMMTFERSLERMPYQVYAVREKVYRDLNRLQNAEAGPRAQPVPANSTLLPPVPNPGGNLGPKTES